MPSIPRIRVAADRFVTDANAPFVPFGVNYYRPGTGWAPQLWKKFDEEATRRDFAVLKFFGVNTVRVFISYGSFYQQPGKLDEEGLRKFDRFLALAEEHGIHVHPTGPDHWEGVPEFARGDRYSEESLLKAQEDFWKLFAGRYRGRNVIFAYDLLNEPMIRWTNATMQPRWNAWVTKRYESIEKAVDAWRIAAPAPGANVPMPAAADKLLDPMLLDYQSFREEIADEWVRRQVEAIKSADSNALVTVGYIQWAIPALIGGVDQYAAFRASRQAKLLDFLEFHFYPLARGAYQYESAEMEARNLAYLESLAVEMASQKKPVVLAEFGWYGGGSMPLGRNAQSKPAGEQEQEKWCTSAVRTTDGHVCGWLNWGFYDHPESRDVSIHTGLLTPDGKPKAWGNAFKRLAEHYAGQKIAPAKIGPRPALPWDRCITSRKAGEAFREEYHRAYVQR